MSLTNVFLTYLFSRTKLDLSHNLLLQGPSGEPALFRVYRKGKGCLLPNEYCVFHCWSNYFVISHEIGSWKQSTWSEKEFHRYTKPVLILHNVREVLFTALYLPRMSNKTCFCILIVYNICNANHHNDEVSPFNTNVPFI